MGLEALMMMMMMTSFDSVCTSDGITTLSPGLHQTLVADLEDLHQKEKEFVRLPDSGVM